MLVQFTTENFLCFKDEATLSMIASKRRAKNKGLDAGAVFDAFDDIKLLKAAAVYGANGSGKSSLFKALSFMKMFVVESSKESLADESINVTPFRLSPDKLTAPSRFEIIFVHREDLFQYEFSVDSSQIQTESLTRRKKGSGREEKLFAREGDKIRLHKSFSEGEGLQKKTRKNALFLSVCANFDGDISTEVIRWFRTLRIISGLSDEGLFNFTVKKLGDASWNAKIRSLLKDFDLGIERLEPGASGKNVFPGDGQVPAELQPLTEVFGKMKVESPKRVTSYHRSFDDSGNSVDEIAFDLRRDESEGTKKLVAMSGPLIDVLENSYILIIDEFDARLHPIITQSILRTFNSSENINHAQLIIATHDTNLLDHELLRRDQIWFTERDYYGAAHLTSLVEYKVRNDASYEKDYIQGKYGAIPIVGDIKRIFDAFSHARDTAALEEE